MSDVTEFFLNGVSPSATGTAFSAILPTKDRRDFAVVLRMPATTGTGADTLDMFIEESDESDFINAFRVKTIDLTNPTTSAVSAGLTQIVGGTALPAATNTVTALRQKWLLKDTNYARYLRIRYVIATTAGSFTNINVMLLSNRKV